MKIIQRTIIGYNRSQCWSHSLCSWHNGMTFSQSFNFIQGCWSSSRRFAGSSFSRDWSFARTKSRRRVNEL